MASYRQKSFEHGIYPVVTEKFCFPGNYEKTIRSLLEGGASILQMREKELSKGALLERAYRIKSLCDFFGAKLIINDHIDIALAVGAFGVHLGQDDFPLKEAKKIAPSLFYGVSTHNIEEVLAAQESGADYINIGPLFSTQTKSLSMAPLGLDYLENAMLKVKIPFSVMGGIKEKHLPKLKALGVKNVAMVTELTQAKDIKGKMEYFLKFLKDKAVDN